MEEWIKHILQIEHSIIVGKTLKLRGSKMKKMAENDQQSEKRRTIMVVDLNYPQSEDVLYVKQHLPLHVR